MSDTRETLLRKRDEAKEALREFHAATGFHEGSGVVGGDWSKRKDALTEGLADIEAKLAALDGNA